MKLSKRQIQGIVLDALAFIVYSVIVFAVPFKKNAPFFTAYIFTVIAFAAQLYVFKLSFEYGENAKSKFYGFPIARIGIIYLAAQIVASLILMAISQIVYTWIVIVVCVVICALGVAGIIAADVVRDEIENQDKKLKKDVSSMRNIQSIAVSICGLCKESPAEKETEKLSESLRFSDPVSSADLKEIESELLSEVQQIQTAAIEKDFDSVIELSKRAHITLSERNRLCKLGK